MARNASEILQACRLLGHVRGPARDRLLAMARPRRYERGTRIFDEGDPCPGVFIVSTGLVRVFKSSPAGKEHVLHLVSPGATFAEVAAIGGFPCPAHAEALADTDCLLLPTEPLVEALAEDHDLCLQLMQGLTGWVRHLVGLMEDITLRDALSRVARHLTASVDATTGKVALPAAKKHLASHLNLTSETLSRALRRLTEAGLIDSDDAGIVVLDPPGLASAAEGLYPKL